MKKKLLILLVIWVRHRRYLTHHRYFSFSARVVPDCSTLISVMTAFKTKNPLCKCVRNAVYQNVLVLQSWRQNRWSLQSCIQRLRTVIYSTSFYIPFSSLNYSFFTLIFIVFIVSLKSILIIISRLSSPSLGFQMACLDSLLILLSFILSYSLPGLNIFLFVDYKMHSLLLWGDQSSFLLST